jgi:hypothetical protein
MNLYLHLYKRSCYGAELLRYISLFNCGVKWLKVYGGVTSLIPNFITGWEEWRASCCVRSIPMWIIYDPCNRSLGVLGADSRTLDKI